MLLLLVSLRFQSKHTKSITHTHQPKSNRIKNHLSFHLQEILFSSVPFQGLSHDPLERSRGWDTGSKSHRLGGPVDGSEIRLATWDA